MDGEIGQRVHRQSWSVVLAGVIESIGRLFDLVRPGAVIAFAICLAALLGLRRLSIPDLPTVSIGFVDFPLAVPSLHRIIFELILSLGVVVTALSWWLPRGQRVALFSLLPLAASALPLVLADPLWAACSLAVVVAALIPVLAQDEADGGAAIFIGMIALGIASLVMGLAAALSSANPEVPSQLPLARAAVLLGCGLIFGIAPCPFWLPGVSRQGHPLGAALAAAIVPALALVVVWTVMGMEVPGPGWLTSGREGEVVVPCGILTVLTAVTLALFQSNIRRLVGFLLVADLGYMVIGLGAGIHVTSTTQAFAAAFDQLIGRGLAVLVVFPLLGFFGDGLSRRLRAAMLALLAYGGLMILGGPLTATFPARWAALQPVVNGDDPWALLLRVGIAISAAAYIVLLARAARLRVIENDRPLPSVALVLLTIVVALSLILWQQPSLLPSQSGEVVTGLLGG